MKNHREELGRDNLAKLLLKYSTPSTIAMLVNSMYNLVDTIFVGRGAGHLALAGLAVSFPVQMIMLALAQTVGLGAASLISRKLGEGDKETPARAAGTAFVTVIILGIFWTILGRLFFNPMLIMFGANEAILPYAHAYLSIILWGAVFFGFAAASNNIIRAEGNANAAMITMLVGALINLILDPIFIFGFKMGIRGAAVATIISQFISFCYVLWFFLGGSSILNIKKSHLKLDFKLLPEIISIGASSLARNAAGSVLAVITNRSLITYGSEIHIAIFGVVNRLIMFFHMPLFGIVQGLQPIIGYNYGAGKPARVKEALNLGIISATVVSVVSFAVLMLFPEQLVGLFTHNEELIAEAIPIVRIISMLLPIVGYQVIGASLFQALGKALPALFLSVSRQVLFLIPCMLILPLKYGLMGVIYSIPVSDLLSFAVTYWFVTAESRRLDNPPKKIPLIQAEDLL